MRIDNKEIVYTYIPPKQDWKDNKPVYTLELYSMCCSVILFKRKFKSKSIKLFSTVEICNFFKDKGIFDDFFIVNDDDVYIENQNGGYNHPNMLYKMLTVENINGPFLHLDNDLFLNDSSTFNDVHNDILFAYEEEIIGTSLNDQYYKFYFNTYIEIIKQLNDESLDDISNFNPRSAFNCCVFGGDNWESIKKSFGRSNEFFRKNHSKLNPIPNMPGFIEQYLQASYLLEDTPFVFISFLNEKIKFPNHVENYDLITSDEKITKYDTSENYNTIDHNLVRNVVDQLNGKDNFHLSFLRWHPHVSVAIYNLLKKLNPSIVTDLENTYGKHPWCIDI